MAEEHMDPATPFKGKPPKKVERKMQKETRLQLIGFFFMLFLTSTAFIAIGSDAIPKSFAFPFIALLAVIQVVLQLYIFMQLRRNFWPSVFMWAALFIAIPTAASLMLLIGIVKF